MRTAGLIAVWVLLLGWGRESLPGADKEDTNKAQEKLQGKWEWVSQVNDGRKANPEDAKERPLRIKGEKLFMLFKGEEHEMGTMKLNPEKNPAQIDVTFTDGPRKGQTAKGIYKLDGDTLSICVGEKDRPTAFESKAGSGNGLWVLKRAK